MAGNNAILLTHIEKLVHQGGLFLFKKFCYIANQRGNALLFNKRFFTMKHFAKLLAVAFSMLVLFVIAGPTPAKAKVKADKDYVSVEKKTGTASYDFVAAAGHLDERPSTLITSYFCNFISNLSAPQAESQNTPFRRARDGLSRG